MRNIKLYLLFAIIAYSFKGYSIEKDLKFKSFSISIQQKDSLLAKEYDSIRSSIKDEKTYPLALRGSLNLLEKSRELGDIRMIFLSSSMVADIYRLTRNHRRAVIYYNIAVSQINQANNVDSNDLIFSPGEHAKTLFSLGSEYNQMQMDDSAKAQYERIAKLNPFNLQVQEYQAKAYTNMAGIYQYKEDYDKALNYAEKAREIHSKTNNKISLAKAKNNIANIYLLKGEYLAAKRQYDEALKLIDKDSSTAATRVKADLYSNKAWAMRNLKDYKAYDDLEISYEYYDKLRNLEMTKALELIASEHNVEVVKQQEQLKQEQLKVEQEKAERNSWIIGISSVFVIILLVFFLVQYNLRQKNMSLELSQKELIQKRKLEQLKAESQIRILNATLDGKETERKQIAETLHDSVSALLSSASLHLQAFKTHFKGKDAPVEVDKTREIIVEASQKIRDLSHTLVSSILLKFGLAYAVKDMSEKYSNSQLKLDYHTDGIRRYNQGFEIKVNNIIQEFVNNILKHSEATEALISITDSEGNLNILIEDNGKGFNKADIPKKDGLGINQIDARIQMMKGTFHIDSSKKKGTKITVEIPILEKEVSVIS